VRERQEQSVDAEGDRAPQGRRSAEELLRGLGKGQQRDGREEGGHEPSAGQPGHAMPERRDDGPQVRTPVEPREIAVRRPLALEHPHAGHDVQSFVDEGPVGDEPDDADLHDQEGGGDRAETRRLS